MRSRPGSSSTALRNGVLGRGSGLPSPATGPQAASRNAALSRTDLDTTCVVEKPPQPALPGVRPRVGFSPNVPQAADGMRMEPPPSLALATGTIPDATA